MTVLYYTTRPQSDAQNSGVISGLTAALDEVFGVLFGSGSSGIG